MFRDQAAGGIELAYRLPGSQTPGWRLLATTIFAMLWLFLVFLLTVPVIRWHIAGRHEWLLSGSASPSSATLCRHVALCCSLRAAAKGHA